ncbi:SAV_2336 N-terminal domain-related protein [Streptomyces sp. NPDC057729]|uniref:caspase, EACC1-associated type n=1 Tax=Streptomyces sp. NPDC057729 TaxID=3346230 RepID=UPI0036C3FE53
MIEELSDALGEAGANVGPEELADILWLASRIDAADKWEQTTAADDPSRTPSAPSDTAGEDSDAEEIGEHGLYNDHTTAGTGDDQGDAGVSVLIRRAPALDDSLGIMRALRPLGKQAKATGEGELDEEATVLASVERRMLVPVMRPSRGRWLDLVIVVDTHPTMVFWHDVVTELSRAVTQAGLFRDVRVWFLGDPDTTGTPTVARTPGGERRSAQELTDPSGHRLVLVVTDTVAEGWGQPTMARALLRWAAHGPVAVVNVMPRRLWDRGAVTPSGLFVRAARPAAPNGTWRVRPVGRRSRPRRNLSARGVSIPVVEATPESLAALVSLVAGGGRWTRMTCLNVNHDDSSTPSQALAGSMPPPSLPSAESALRRFQATASPPARCLAGHLAAVPITLPVMTLVRRAMVGESDHGHVAEVALGGLFQPWHPLPPRTDLDRYTFHFLPGVREALIGGQDRQDITAVQELVRRSVSGYLDQVPATAGEFRAVRGGPHITQGDRVLATGALPFAHTKGPEFAPVGVPLSESRQWARSYAADSENLMASPHAASLRQVVQRAEQGTSQLVVLTGPAATGKTHAAWEAVRLLSGDWRIWEPRSAEEFLTAAHRVGPRTVVWLDDIESICSGDDHEVGVRAAQSVIALADHRDPSRGPVLTLVMRRERDDTHPFTYVEGRADHLIFQGGEQQLLHDIAETPEALPRPVGAVLPPTPAATESYASADPVVQVRADGQRGSGVLVRTGVLTARHLVSDARRITVTVRGVAYTAEVHSTQGEVVLLTITDPTRPDGTSPVVGRFSQEILKGQRVQLQGVAGGAGRIRLGYRVSNVTGTRIVALLTDPVVEVLPTAVDFVELSGAPIMDDDGRLVGVVTDVNQAAGRPTGPLVGQTISSLNRLLGSTGGSGPERDSRLPRPNDSRAVLVATASTSSPTLPALPSVVPGLERLSALLTREGPAPAFDPLTVTTVIDPAMSADVLRPLHDAAAEARDVLLFYFAGHALLNSRGELHLVCSSTDPKLPDLTAVSARTITDILLTSPARRRLVILDCDYSGRWPSMESGDVWMLGATSGSRAAHAPSGARYTAFTGALIDVLQHGVPHSSSPVLDLHLLCDEVSLALRTREGLSAPLFRNGPSGLALGLNRGGPELGRQRGRVKWFNTEKGYGFITPDHGSDIFVHYTDLQMTGFRTLEEGQLVDFRIVDGEKGPQASDVHVVTLTQW